MPPSRSGVVRVVTQHIRCSPESEQRAVKPIWLWAWANFDLLENVRSRITSVQAFGNMHALPKLTIRKWRCSEEDTWKIAAVAAAVLEAQGVYRAQSRNGPVFMAIMNRQRLH
jgi:hypothetical protein